MEKEKLKKLLIVKLAAMGMFGSVYLSTAYVSTLRQAEIEVLYNTVSKSQVMKVLYAGGGTSPKLDERT